MNRIDIKIIKNKDYEKWDRIVKSSKYGSIFHTIDWMNIIEKNYNISKLPIGIYVNDELVGIFPSFFSKKMHFKLLMSPQQRCSTPYGGPVLSKAISVSRVMKSYDSFIKEIFNPNYIDIKFLYDIKLDSYTLSSLGFNVENRYTYLLNIGKSENELWKNLRRSCKQSIKKAIKNNIEIIEDEVKDEYINEYYKMVIDTWKKTNQRPLLKKKMYKDILREFIKNGRVKFFLAKYNGNIIAGVIRLCFNKKLYAFDRASYRKYYKICPNNLLDWHVLKWANKNGFNLYDFVGAQVPSIAHYKAGFGGKLTSYLYIYKGSKLAMFSRNIYEKYYKWKERI